MITDTSSHYCRFHVQNTVADSEVNCNKMNRRRIQCRAGNSTDTTDIEKYYLNGYEEGLGSNQLLQSSEC